MSFAQRLAFFNAAYEAAYYGFHLGGEYAIKGDLLYMEAKRLLAYPVQAVGIDIDAKIKGCVDIKIAYQATY